MRILERWPSDWKEWLKRHAWAIGPGGAVFNVMLLLIVLVNLDEDQPGSISLSLTILEIFLVALAVVGFWLVRGAAIRASKEETNVYMEREGVPLIRRTVEDWLDYHGSQNPEKVRAIMEALDPSVEERGDG